MTNEDNIDKLFEEFYSDEISRPIPHGFKSRTMNKIRGDVANQSQSWLNDNLWVVVMAVIIIGIAIWAFTTGRNDIAVPPKGDLQDSFNSNRNLWYQIIAMLCAGVFVYYIQLITARTPNGAHQKN